MRKRCGYVLSHKSPCMVRWGRCIGHTFYFLCMLFSLGLEIRRGLRSSPSENGRSVRIWRTDPALQWVNGFFLSSTVYGLARYWDRLHDRYVLSTEAHRLLIGNRLALSITWCKARPFAQVLRPSWKNKAVRVQNRINTLWCGMVNFHGFAKPLTFLSPNESVASLKRHHWRARNQEDWITWSDDGWDLVRCLLNGAL